MLNNCVVTLHANSNGTASTGASQWNNIAPAMAENANPANPADKAPMKTAIKVIISVKFEFARRIHASNRHATKTTPKTDARTNHRRFFRVQSQFSRRFFDRIPCRRESHSSSFAPRKFPK